jgi:hypothetical protein
VDRMDTMSLFVAAIDTGSLSGAARASGTSLPSVSRHLSALEERVGGQSPGGIRAGQQRDDCNVRNEPGQSVRHY